MAGEGKRFKNEGYELPKPLIEVNKVPMVIKALNSLPKADKNLFIIRKDQIDYNNFKKTVSRFCSNFELILLDKLSEGQASTCLFAENYVKSSSIINIGSCDVGYSYNYKEFNKALSINDCLIWAYKNKNHVLKKPNMYGWVKTLNNTKKVDFVSCKKTISNNPLNDYVVSGTFTFKDSNLFFSSIKKMMELDDRINNEFYIDNIFNHIELKKSVFEVDEIYSWGTPHELKTYLENSYD
jgi:dTDP-glucose pyrophosphorylase